MAGEADKRRPSSPADTIQQSILSCASSRRGEARLFRESQASDLQRPAMVAVWEQGFHLLQVELAGLAGLIDGGNALFPFMEIAEVIDNPPVDSVSSPWGIFISKARCMA